MTYEIYSISTPDVWYVGSTTRGVEVRLAEHFGSHGGAALLTEKIEELGADAFTVSVLERGEGDPIIAEQRWFDTLYTALPGQTLNRHRPGQWDVRMLGARHTLATREKQSAAMLGNKNGAGKSCSLEKRAKLSAALMGHSVPNEVRAKMGRLGRKDSDEARAKKSAAQKLRWAKVREQVA